MKKYLSNILLILVFLAGVSLLLYPSVSDYWNGLHQSRAIASYTEAVARLDNTDYERLWTEAEAYNQALPRDDSRYRMDESQRKQYERLLNVSGNGVMGYVEIPRINCMLPIYHGTDPAVLQVAAGHVEGTSLPVGGPGTHTVLSGHRGLPSARLFSNLDQMEEGDRFQLHVLNETLVYEVDQILVVLPEELEALAIDENRDYCTLVTCTPYGVNSHRLLVRGQRVIDTENGGTADGGEAAPGRPGMYETGAGGNPADGVPEASVSRAVRRAVQCWEAFLSSPLGIPAAAASALLILFLALLLGGRRNVKNGKKEKRKEAE